VKTKANLEHFLPNFIRKRFLQFWSESKDKLCRKTPKYMKQVRHLLLVEVDFGV
jgi:hypothetical protein